IRLRRVEIFRIGAVERTSAESDQRARLSVNRNHQAIAKPIVVAGPALARHHQTRELERLLAMFASEASEDVVPRVGRISEAVFFDDVFADSAVVEIFPRRIVGKSEGLMKSFGGFVDDFEQVVFVAFPGRLAATGKLDADARGHVLDRLRKRESLGEREELENVAARAAAEAVEKPFVAIDME